ncbi:MAG: hypothetical protein JKX87_07645 [Cycloclasticus sp.]|nr:hypothetical protein [Cycloclasticus sp.]
MTDQSMELMHQLMKTLNKKMDQFAQAQRQTNEHLLSIDSHMEGFFRSNNIQDQQIAELLDRVERLEKQQELTERH